MPSGGDQRTFALAAGAVLVADLATKFLAEAWLQASPGVEVVGEWVRLRLIHNPGAAFGVSVGSWSRIGFSLVAVVAIVLLARLAFRAPAGDWLRRLAAGLVAGGAAGNLIDRIRDPQGVVDFLDVGIGAHRWPTFNLADIGVSIGALALGWSLWSEDRRGALAGTGTSPEPGALS